VAAALLAPALAWIAATVAISLLRGAGALPRPFVAHPEPALLVGFLCGGAGALLAPALLGRLAGRPGLLAGAAIVQAAGAAALGLWLPLASPPFAVPALAFAAGEALRAASRFGGRRAAVADLLPSVASGLVLSPLALFLPALLGVLVVPVAAALFSLVLSPAASAAVDGEARGRFRPGLAALAGAAVAAALQLALPHATASSPERLALVYVEGGGAPRWLAEGEGVALPPALRAAAPFSPLASPAFPWTPHTPAFSAPAPALGVPPPRIELLGSTVQDGVRRVRLRLRSTRGAPTLSLAVPDERIVSVTVDGLRLPPPSRLAVWLRGGFRVVTSDTAPPAGHAIELELRGEAPVEVVAVDRSPGLPPAGAPLVAARPAWAVTSWEGDGTIATARARL
jgi:hypothetical protein